MRKSCSRLASYWHTDLSIFAGSFTGSLFFVYNNSDYAHVQKESRKDAF